MNKKKLCFIVGFLFFMIGMMISNRTILGSLIGTMGGIIIGLSLLLDKNQE